MGSGGGFGTQMGNGLLYNPQFVGFGPENLMAGLGCFQSNFSLTQATTQVQNESTAQTSSQTTSQGG